MIRISALILGILAFFHGGLWLLQGLGVVHLQLILFFADCAPLQGPSVTWAVIGAVLMAAGGVGVVSSRRQNPD